MLKFLLTELPKVAAKEEPSKPEKTESTAGASGTKMGRAWLYAAKWKPCPEGERNQTAFRHAAELRQFDLSEQEALPIVADWNRENSPPLSDKELGDAVRNGYRYATKPGGSKLKEDRQKAAFKPATAPKPAQQLHELLEATIDGRRQAIAWPWPWLSKLTKSLLPGTVTLLCGTIGASKSFMLLQAFAYWFTEGVQVALFELEENVEYHLQRILAQQAENANLTDPDWPKDNADETRQALTEHQGYLDEIGKGLWAVSDSQPTLEQLAAWVENQSKAGCRVICIDPITAASQTPDPWIADNCFLQRVKRAATEYGVSIILVTHAKKGGSHLIDMDSLAGGAAYARFAQTILWLESHESKKQKARDVCGSAEVESNRTVHILKARNGKGGGMRLAFVFGADTLTLTEFGIVVKEKK
jgi:hypothetical protein